MAKSQYLVSRLDPEQRLWLDIPLESGELTLSTAVWDALETLFSHLAEKHLTGLVMRFVASHAVDAETDAPIAGKVESSIEFLARFTDESQNLLFINRLEQLCTLLETATVPSVFIMSSNCPIGGMALALATDYCISPLTMLTENYFPEQTVGLHAAPAIVRRAVRRLGTQDALQMLTATYSTLLATSTASINNRLPDAVVSAEKLSETAMNFLRDQPPKRRAALSSRLFNGPVLRSITTAQQLNKVEKNNHLATRHYPATYALFRLWQQYGSRNHTNVQQAYARSLSQLAQDCPAIKLTRLTQLRHRIHAQIPTESTSPLRQLHLIGSGVTACEIAAYGLLQGIKVSLYDQRPAALTQATRCIEDKLLLILETQSAQLTELMTRFVKDQTGQQAKEADMALLISSAPLADQQEILLGLETACRPDAIIATHTTVLPLRETAAALQAPQRLVGIHFSFPVHSTPLAEISYTSVTDNESLDTACSMLKALNKLPLMINNVPGLLIDRLLVLYVLQGIQLNQQGVPHTIIDRAARDAGIATGPLELADQIGLDHCLRIAEAMKKTLSIEIPYQLIDRVKTGKLGKKSGSGFYRYRNNNRLKPDRLEWDGNVEALQNKLVMRLNEEAALCLEDGLTEDPDLIDAALVFGTGFAPWQGGPLFYLHQQAFSPQRIKS